MLDLVRKMCYLSCPLRSLWYLVGPSSDPGALGNTRRETLGSRLGFLSISARFLEYISRFVGKHQRRMRVFVISVSKLRFLMISGSGSGRPGIGCRGSEDSLT